MKLLIFSLVAMMLAGCGGDSPPSPLPNPVVPKTMIGSPALAEHSYEWSPCEGLSDCKVAQPFASPKKTTTFTVTATTKCGKSVSSVKVRVFQKKADGSIEEVL